MDRALSIIGEQDSGVLIYLRRPENMQPVHDELSNESINAAAKMKEYGIGAQILKDLGVKKISLLSGSTTALSGLEAYGLTIVSRTSI